MINYNMQQAKKLEKSERKIVQRLKEARLQQIETLNHVQNLFGGSDPMSSVNPLSSPDVFDIFTVVEAAYSNECEKVR